LFCFVLFCFSTCRGGDDPCQTYQCHQTQWQSAFIFPLWFWSNLIILFMKEREQVW
jgi:hypothetical protein